MTTGPLSYYPFVQSDPLMGSPAAAGQVGAAFMMENFPFSEGEWISDPAGDLWNISPVLSFVSFFAIKGFSSLYWFDQQFNQGVGHPVGNVGIWGLTNGTFASAVKLYDGGLNDATLLGRHTFSPALDISPYAYLCIASDPALGGSGLCYSKQRSIGEDDISAPTFQFPDSCYLGVHLGGANSVYSAIPLIPSNDPKYFMQQWLRIGVS